MLKNLNSVDTNEIEFPLHSRDPHCVHLHCAYKKDSFGISSHNDVSLQHVYNLDQLCRLNSYTL